MVFAESLVELDFTLELEAVIEMVTDSEDKHVAAYIEAAEEYALLPEVQSSVMFPTTEDSRVPQRALRSPGLTCALRVFVSPGRFGENGG